MQICKIIILLLALCVNYAQAQQNTTSSNQSRTIEINNTKGDLKITFTNNVITKFVVNGEQVPKEQYPDYQNIIDGFSDEEVQPTAPTPPTPPTPPVTKDDNKNELLTRLKDYLSDEELINLSKYKIQLKQDYLKVNRKKLSPEVHQACLDIFSEVYGHDLNSNSSVKLKKSKNNYSSSIRIVD